MPLLMSWLMSLLMPRLNDLYVFIVQLRVKKMQFKWNKKWMKCNNPLECPSICGLISILLVNINELKRCSSNATRNEWNDELNAQTANLRINGCADRQWSLRLRAPTEMQYEWRIVININASGQRGFSSFATVMLINTWLMLLYLQRMHLN